MVLAADAETPDERLVPREILALQVVEKTPALADHRDQSATRMMVFRVGLEMFGQTFDALGKERDLDLRGCGIFLVGTETLNDFRYLSCSQRHFNDSFSFPLFGLSLTSGFRPVKLAGLWIEHSSQDPALAIAVRDGEQSVIWCDQGHPR